MIPTKRTPTDEGEIQGTIQFFIHEQLTLPSGQFTLKSFNDISNAGGKAVRLLSDDFKAVLKVPPPNPNKPPTDYERGYSQAVEDIASLIARSIRCSVSTKKINGTIYLSRNHGPSVPPPPAAEPKPILEIITYGKKLMNLDEDRGLYRRTVFANGKEVRDVNVVLDKGGAVQGWKRTNGSVIYHTLEKARNGHHKNQT